MRIIQCDKCGGISKANSLNEFKTPISILNIEMNFYNKDYNYNLEYHLCDTCLKRFKEWLKEDIKEAKEG